MFKRVSGMASKAKQFAIAAVLGFASVGGAAMAQTTIDTGAVTTTIAAGVVAASAIGAAWAGFKYLKKVWNRV